MLLVILCFITDFYSLLQLQLAMAKDPEAAFFKRLEGLQPCEVSALKSGTHIFAVYGVHSCRLLVSICIEGTSSS